MSDKAPWDWPEVRSHPVWKGQEIVSVYVNDLPTSCTACNYQYVSSDNNGDLVCGCLFLPPYVETSVPDDIGRRPCCPLKKATKKIRKASKSYCVYSRRKVKYV